ncbi:MAG TPA: hypothetical protein VFV38_48185 [Ktedonobacteraceae bacterium]|nr:hypothetical protein [Ktedonobacteraceae bacterium]
MLGESCTFNPQQKIWDALSAGWVKAANELHVHGLARLFHRRPLLQLDDENRAQNQAFQRLTDRNTSTKVIQRPGYSKMGNQWMPHPL